MRVRECVSACAASDEGSYVRCAAADMSACLSVCHDAASVVLQGVVGVVLPLTISLTLMAAAHLSSVMELRHFCTPLGEDTLPRACLTRWPWAPKGAVAGAHGCRAWSESMNANLCMILSSGSLDPFDVFDHQVPQSVLAYYLVCGAGHSHAAASEKTAAHAILLTKVQATTQSHYCRSSNASHGPAALKTRSPPRWLLPPDQGVQSVSTRGTSNCEESAAHRVARPSVRPTLARRSDLCRDRQREALSIDP